MNNKLQERFNNAVSELHEATNAIMMDFIQSKEITFEGDRKVKTPIGSLWLNDEDVWLSYYDIKGITDGHCFDEYPFVKNLIKLKKEQEIELINKEIKSLTDKLNKLTKKQ